MTTSTKAQILTAAFNDGVAAYHDPRRGWSSRLIHKGTARDFFEKGYETAKAKAEAERRAYEASPEYVADRARQRAADRALISCFIHAVMEAELQHIADQRKRAAAHEAAIQAAERLANV